MNMLFTNLTVHITTNKSNIFYEYIKYNNKSKTNSVKKTERHPTAKYEANTRQQIWVDQVQFLEI